MLHVRVRNPKDSRRVAPPRFRPMLGGQPEAKLLHVLTRHTENIQKPFQDCEYMEIHLLRGLACCQDSVKTTGTLNSKRLPMQFDLSIIDVCFVSGHFILNLYHADVYYFIWKFGQRQGHSADGLMQSGNVRQCQACGMLVNMLCLDWLPMWPRCLLIEQVRATKRATRCSVSNELTGRPSTDKPCYFNPQKLEELASYEKLDSKEYQCLIWNGIAVIQSIKDSLLAPVLRKI